MGADNQMEKLIIENVMKELAKRGLFGGEAEDVCKEVVKKAGDFATAACC